MNPPAMTNLYSFLLRNFISYDRLFELNKHAFYMRSDADAVNIFIDMHSLLADMFKPGMVFNYASTNVLTASMINLAAHIRAYYTTRHRVMTNIFIVWAWNAPQHIRQRIPSYNAHQITAEGANGIFTTMINENLNLLKMLCPYIPNVYFINAEEHEAATAIYAMFTRPFLFPVNTSVPNVIITRDPMCYLDVAELPNTFIFRPKKYRGEDRSYIVTKTNMIESFITNECKWKYNPEVYGTNYQLFVPLIKHAGMRCRNVDGVLPYRDAGKMLNKGESAILISSEEEALRNLSWAFDIRINDAILGDSPVLAEMQTGCLNQFDPKSVQDINNQYFTDYPLDLNVL